MKSSNAIKSPPLAELQDWLRSVFTEPGGVAAALDARPGLLGAIADRPPAGVFERLAVYSDAYFLRLLDSLGSDFAAVRRALGDDLFRRLVADYLAGHPSHSPNIGDLGRDLPDFAASHPLRARFPFLPDLARLEWAVLSRLSIDRLPPFDPASLTGVSAEAWAGARLVFDPTVALLDLAWPVDRLWRGKGPRRLRRPLARRLLVYRDDDWVQVRALGALERRTMGALLSGRTLGEVCAELEKSSKKPAVEKWLSDWTTSGVIKRVEF